MSAAITAKNLGADVAIASKAKVGHANNTYISAGIIASPGQGDLKDSPEVHLRDIIKSGRFINIASLAGLVGHPFNAAYAASKHALIGFTKSIRVELHWRLNQNAYLLPLSLDEFWDKREFVRFGGDRVATMPHQELLLYLCAHGAHTGWFRLKWLCDIAALIGEDSLVRKIVGDYVDRAQREYALYELIV